MAQRSEKSTYVGTITLTGDDVRAMNRRIEGDGGFQCLLRDLQGQMVGRYIYINSEVLAERVVRYAYDYGDGGWQARMQRWANQLPPVPAHEQGELF